LKDLKPALNFTTTLVNIREIEKGEKIGYNCTYTAPKKMKIGLLPIGYNDGLDRRLSNMGFVKYQNKFLPILGRVSMNMTSISLEGTNPKYLDKVEIISCTNNDRNSIEKIAAICNTIPYDVMVHLDPSTKRSVI
jgi:alanine racemase